MAKRHQDALAIQQGACNPSGIALAVVDACREARAESKDAAKDPAVRLMVHQLAFICNVREIEEGLDTYDTLTRECQEAAMKGVKTDET